METQESNKEKNVLVIVLKNYPNVKYCGLEFRKGKKKIF